MMNPEYADRWKDAYWDLPTGGETHSMYEALLQIHSDDRIGMLADITVALADMRVSILQVNVVRRTEDDSIINLKVGCKNIEHYNSIVSRLRSTVTLTDSPGVPRMTSTAASISCAE